MSLPDVEMLSAAEIARMAGVSVRLIQGLEKDGKMPPAVRLGRLRRWHRDVISGWLRGDWKRLRRCES